MALLTSRTLAQSSAITPTTLIHIVTTADTSQSSYGSSYKAELQQLQSIFGSNPDLTVTGGTYNPSTGIVTFYNNTGGTFDVSGFITGFTDSFVSGGTYSAGTATFTNTTGGTFTVTGFTTPFTGNTSATCISDLYVSNIHSCSPLNINPLDEGNVYFGSTSGVTIDLTNNRVGVGTTSPTAKLHVSGTSYFDTTGLTTSTIPSFRLLDGVSTPTDTTNIKSFYKEFRPTTTSSNTVVTDGTIIYPNINSSTSAEFYASANLTFFTDDLSDLSSNEALTGEVNLVSIYTNTGTYNGIVKSSSSVLENAIAGGTIDKYVGFWANGLSADITHNGTTNNIYGFYMDSQSGRSGNVPPTTNRYGVYIEDVGRNYFAGTVGIGTDSPSEKLDVSGKTKTINFQMTSGATNGYVLTSDASGNATWQASSGVFTGNTSASCISDLYVSNIHSCSPLNINPLDEGNVYFGSTSGVTVDVINSRLGIGTNSPTQKLHISGNAGTVIYEGTNHVFQQYYPQGISGGRFGYIGYAASGSTDLRIQSEKPGGLLYLGTEGNITMTFSGSNVGVNIAPTAKFHINNTSSFNSFLVEDDTNPDTSPFVIDNEGRVGIGTTTPTYKLQVNGTYGSMSYDPNRVRVSGDTDAGTFDSELILSGTTSGATVINLVSGNISFGAYLIGKEFTGTTIYGVSGDTALFQSSEAKNLNIVNSPGTGNDNIRFYAGQIVSGTTPDMIIKGNGVERGFVGIGTSSPSEKLEVSGKTKTTNFQMTSGATSGYVLTSDGSGNASWQASTGGGGVSIDPYNDVGSTGTSFNWNVSGLSTNYEVTLTANTTLNLSNVRNGDYGTIILTQDGTGGRTITFGTVNGGATTHRVVNGGGGTPTLTSNASAIDILTFTYNGLVMFWTVGNDYT